MNLGVRDGKLDVAIVAGPRMRVWPSVGVLELSRSCTEMGLTAGLFGGESMTVRGVIPLPGTGGIVLIEDVQHRIHRIHARAVVKVCEDSRLPDPFQGWRSQGLIPLSTAERLCRESLVRWDPTTVVLGSGNEALRFASSLLEAGTEEVFCVESWTRWGAKRFAGWEVERRRFEILGGKLIEAKPLKLSPKAALLWEFKLQDAQGVRVLDVARVVSAGPFREQTGVREHPPGSALFELEQTASATREDDVEGWSMEEERGRWLAGKIIKALAIEVGVGGGDKEALERVFKRARGRIKRYLRHREAPFTPAYQGKWIASADMRQIKAFKGVPQQEHQQRLIASVECFEEIPCNVCMTACPEGAIELGHVPRTRDSMLTESKCLSCGICVSACPSSAIVMMHEKPDRPMSTLVLPWRGKRPWKAGEFAIAVNRKGESLGNVRVVELMEPKFEGAKPAIASGASQLVRVDVPNHLLWEVRGLKRARAAAVEDEAYLEAVRRSSLGEEKVDVTLNGERRMVRDKVPLSVALFEMGQSRPEDVLFCPDGACGLCQVNVDGVKKLACQTKTHRGMAVRLAESPAPTQGERSLCPCLGITVEQVVERLKQGNLQSPEAVLSVTHVGEGKCHGQLCMEAFKRALLDQGLDASQWADWRFPWSEWVLSHN